MVNTASEPIYPNNANLTMLEFVMKLLHWKNKHNCSNNGFDDLLLLIGSVLPDDHKLPENYYTVRKMIKGLNMEYEKIDACENDCMLIYKEHSKKTKCDIRKEDRYKVQKDPKKQKIPRKILRYFPITMRLQRLFMVEKTAKCMRWHHDRIVVEGELSHPADGDEWKKFDRKFQRFLKEIWNVRLGLPIDGFDPFRDKHAREYTVWPVVVIVYNLPHLCAALLWTISDFPALAKLSGWSTKDDPLRRSTRFGRGETRSDCARHSGSRAKVMCEQIQFPPPGKSSKKKPKDYGVTHNWTHSSPFFQLPYWETLSLRHSIDIMHTEKNVFDNIFYTILDDSKKSKDKTKSRKDCQELGVHRELWIQDNGIKPHSPYVLSSEQVQKMYKWIVSLKFPDGYASNISRCVNWKKNCIRGMKSHDCHVFMQKMLPIICRDLLPKYVSDTIIELCNFFKDLCSSSLKYTVLEKMERDIVRIMSKLETVFTPSLFDPMEHLPLHLATECKLGGPANGRWMYFIEIYLHNLKLKVGNKARAEGSMAQRYIEEECVHFCTLYFDSKNGLMYNQLRRNEAPQMFHNSNLLEVYTYPTHLSLRTRDIILSCDEYELVAYYVLINSPEVQDDEELNKKFIDLIRGPFYKVESYKSCKCNGYKFDYVNANEITSPNSGVVVIGTSYEEHYGNYYGRIEEILKLFYQNGHQVIVFKCHWFDHTAHVKVDKHRMTTVDVKSKLNAKDMFVLAQYKENKLQQRFMSVV
ncbi:uncharacterized protein LOC141680689 [Apium graveolens]|uniref:uncharacterized protein LOC141680689 n=1 Tax=Apium graveolens TaxID=4045 RepID=UPI003D78F431